MESQKYNHEEKEKRKRAGNWLEGDKELLQDLIKKKVSLIENKNTDTNTNKSKQNAWLDVKETFNQICAGTQRTTEQLKAQWKGIKIQARKTVSERRKEIRATGGGPAAQDQELSSTDICVWLPNEFVTDNNKFDSDAANVEYIDEETEDYWSAKHNVEVEDERKDNVKSEKAEKTEKHIMNPGSKKKMAAPQSQFNIGIKEFAEVEVRCKQEQHNMQMEREKLQMEKERILLSNAKLEQERLQMQIKEEKRRQKRREKYDKYKLELIKWKLKNFDKEYESLEEDDG